MKIVFYYPKCPSKFVTMHRFCAEILSRRKNPSVNAQAKEKKQRGKNRGGSRNYDLYIDVLYFSSTPSIFFFFKASQCTQVNRKQMEQRYLIYSENCIVFLIYIPVQPVLSA